MWRALICGLLACLLAGQERFVRLAGGAMPGRPGVALDELEVADAPVTNNDYLEFVRASGHRAPAHWVNGKPPAGFENHPVIYVNRYDAEAYVAWRSQLESRVYRLPTSAEFEYAARAGNAEAIYPWGSADPEGHANYDAEGKRAFPDWQAHLKPVRSYPPNSWGLYDMAGNVWQMVTTDADPAQRRWVFRMTMPFEKESTVAGGSWARGPAYLRVTARGGAGGAGITHPDLGFRLVREVRGTYHLRRTPRRVVALPGAAGVFLSWQLLPGDNVGSGFHVYRSPRRDAAGIRLTSAPLRNSTTWVDPAKLDGVAYYRVRAVLQDGVEGPPSEWATAGLRKEEGNIAAVFEPSAKEGNCSPVFGDLDGDGVLDVVFRCDSGIKENTRDPGVPVELEAFTSYGKQLWRKPLIDYERSYGNANNAPFLVADLDGDGRSEVVARLQMGAGVFLAVLNGLTGEVLRMAPWPAMATDHSGTSTRVHMAVANLTGQRLSIITQTGLYENERFHAFDAFLKAIWQFDSFGPTSGSGSHHVDVADVDGDGRDEVFDGTTLLNHDGSVRWSLYRLHPDIVAIKHILGNQTRQVYFAVESNTHAGAYVVDAATGKLHWKLNREDDSRWVHAHVGWAADIDASSPGYELLTNRDGHEAKETVLFSGTGKILMEGFPWRMRPVNWTGGVVRDLLPPDSRQLHRFDGRLVAPVANETVSAEPCRFVMSADLLGDYRDEIVCAVPKSGGGEVFRVLTNTTLASRAEVTRTSSREYRLWLARNIGAGYASYFEWEPGH